MELRVEFLPQFKVEQPQLSSRLLPSRVNCIFNREILPASYCRWQNLEVHCNHDQIIRHPHDPSIRHPAALNSDGSDLPDLSFDRLQLTDQQYCGLEKRYFGRYIAREAVLDEEYWTAAWLRAEAHWESLSFKGDGVADRMSFAEEEFNALKRRCKGRNGNLLKCFCLVAVKKEEKNVKRTVLSSVVGTLDLSICQFLHGETYPGEVKRPSPVLASSKPFDAHKYAYIANVCVTKFARRQGIASNMLYMAIDVATSAGLQQLYIHVNGDNKPAQDLYKKIGFKMIEADSPPQSRNGIILMSMELQVSR